MNEEFSDDYDNLSKPMMSEEDYVKTHHAHFHKILVFLSQQNTEEKAGAEVEKTAIQNYVCEPVVMHNPFY